MKKNNLEKLILRQQKPNVLNSKNKGFNLYRRKFSKKKIKHCKRKTRIHYYNIIAYLC